jgi:hypothetical protein
MEHSWIDYLDRNKPKPAAQVPPPITEEQWLAKPDYQLIKHLMSERTKRLYAVACARLTPRPLRFDLLDEAADVVERAADELVTEREVADVCHRALRVVAVCKTQPSGWWSAQHFLAIAAERLTSPLGLEYARTVPGFLFESHGGKAYETYPPDDIRSQILQLHAAVLRDVLFNPFRDIHGERLLEPRPLRQPLQFFLPEWRTSTAVALARGMYESRDFEAMPILADALQDAGCGNEELLGHCRNPGQHARGCWVVDLVLDLEVY